MKAKWTAVLLNSGANVATNETIIPRAVFNEVTTAYAIVQGGPEEQLVGYGMGWGRSSYLGHEVSHRP